MFKKAFDIFWIILYSSFEWLYGIFLLFPLPYRWRCGGGKAHAEGKHRRPPSQEGVAEYRPIFSGRYEARGNRLRFPHQKKPASEQKQSQKFNWFIYS
jgi:hypothetical protein